MLTFKVQTNLSEALGRVVYQLNSEETQRVGVRLAGAKA